MLEEPPIVKLIKEGKITFEEGKMTALGEIGIILPVRVMNKLYFLLKEKLGKRGCHEILHQLGSYQIRQAISRYMKILGWSTVEKQKAFEFGFKFLTSFLGIGLFKVEKQENVFFISTSKTPFAEELILEYGKQSEPIDYYLCGMWEEVFTIFTGKPMICEEVKCYAKGDDCCEFVVKPKE
jgi:predicted hydrocarbon binding protein